VTLKEMLAAARERDRLDREAQKARLRRYAKALELEKLGVSAVAVSGYPDASMPEDDLDRMLAAEKQRQAEVYLAIGHAEKVTTFCTIRVQVLSGQVYSIGNCNHAAKTNSSRLLGLLGDAEAKVTDSTSAFSLGKAMVMPLATAALARKDTADVLIVFRDGTIHTTALDGSMALRDARRECVEFNAIAATAGRASAQTATDPAARLQKLQDLMSAGLLSQDEYQSKRAAIVDGL